MSQLPTVSTALYVREASDYRLATPEETLAAARRTLSHRFRRGCALDSPGLVREYLKITLGTMEHEVFCLILVDNRHRLLAWVELFRGTIDGASVHPREVVKEALKHNAAAVILAHNHPSGVAEPSQADELITHRLRDALALVDVRVLDHLVVGGDLIVSFAERGLL
jgi:DNA repair protein RadC